MGERFVVRQGDHLSSIAAAYGFPDNETIWNHPDNAELKQLRVNPNVLYPGDIVCIPDKETKDYSGATEKRHNFVMHGEPLSLSLILDRAFYDPLGGTECELWIEGRSIPLTTDGTGGITCEIKKTDKRGLLQVKDSLFQSGLAGAPDVQIPVQIGWLDPVEEESGQVVRLWNLGYYTGPIEPVDQDLLLLAIEEFQCENDLTVDGDCGPQTQAKLKEVYGC